MEKTTFLITAAGGNGTAIRILDQALSRSEYSEQGQELGMQFEADGAEQAGFLIPADSHFEMTGGEFCGNASRAAAVLLSELQQKEKVAFTVSGFSGEVEATVVKNEGSYFVRCVFPGLPTQRQSVVLSEGQHADVIDLGGIVHVVIEGTFPQEAAFYEAMHRAITRELRLEDRAAVGVVWFRRTDDSVIIDPVVWVKDAKTFYFEQSCGSGSIAVAKVAGVTTITQPTGKNIEALISDDTVVLESEMEIVRAED